MGNQNLPSFPGTQTPATNAGGGAVGTSVRFAREDHVHPATPTPSAPSPANATPLVESGGGAVGTSLLYARQDHVHPLGPQPSPATVAPLAPGAAAVGTSALYARQDHVHPAQAVPSAASAAGLADTASGTVGTSAAYAREDHTHPLPTGRLSLLTTTSVGETALITLGLSVRRYSVTVSGVATTDRIVAALNGIPTNGSLQDVYVSATNTISVGALIPVLGIASTVAIPIALYRVT